MAKVPTMKIKVILEGRENLALEVPQTRANIAKLEEAYGKAPRVLKVRNPYGATGAPKVPVVPAAKTAAKRKTVKPKSAKVTAAA